MASLKTIIALLVLCVPLIQAAATADWRSRSIYQVLTDRFARTDNSETAPCDTGAGLYCGGSFQGIINKLDYIQNLGFSAVWISPVTYQIPEITADLSAYHGYWQQDMYRVNPFFGTVEDLLNLSKELHSRNMYLMFDVVANHLAYAGNGSTVPDWTRFNPFNDPKYFHPFKLLSSDPYNATCAQVCWLGDLTVSLPDLKSEDPIVASMLDTWITELVSNYSVDGLRIDSIFNMNPDFFPGFNQAAGVFCLGEGSTNLASSLCPLSTQLDGLINYPMYYSITNAFKSTSANISTLVDGMNSVQSQCKDVTAMGLFSENHDLPRFASNNGDIALARNVLAFDLLGDGIPVIYYGAEQHLSGAFNPANREALWLTGYSMTSTSLPSLVQSLNRLRAHAANMSTPGCDYLTCISVPIYTGTHTLALLKGFDGNQVVTVLTNLGSNPGSSLDEQITLEGAKTNFKPQETLTEVLSCTSVVTDGSGNLQVTLNDGGPKVYYPSAGLAGSNLCGYS
ncbi:Glycoside hydrolase superfamily [Elaphomyces granulatus]